MQIIIVYSRKQIILCVAALMIVAIFMAAGGRPLFALIGVGAPEFVGNLIGTFHGQPWSWLDPTYSHCF